MKKQVRLERQASVMLSYSALIIGAFSLTLFAGLVIGFLFGYYYGRP